MLKRVHYIVCENKRIAYIPIQKVATRSFINRLSKLSGVTNYRQINSMGMVRQASLLEPNLSVLYEGTPILKKYFKFAFVRHPLDRLVSFWRNKLAPGSNSEVDYSAFGIYKGIGFADFITRLTAIDVSKLEVHLMPQIFFLCPRGTLLVDYIGRFENLPGEYEMIAKIFGGDDPLPMLNYTNQVKGFEEYYTPTLRSLAKSYYETDFRFFGYD